MLNRDSLNDLDLTFFWQPFDDGVNDVIFFLLWKHWQSRNSVRFERVNQTPSETVNDVFLTLPGPIDVVEQTTKDIILQLMKLILVFLKPWDQMVFDGIFIIPLGSW